MNGIVCCFYRNLPLRREWCVLPVRNSFTTCFSCVSSEAVLLVLVAHSTVCFCFQFCLSVHTLLQNLLRFWGCVTINIKWSSVQWLVNSLHLEAVAVLAAVKGIKWEHRIHQANETWQGFSSQCNGFLDMDTPPLDILEKNQLKNFTHHLLQCFNGQISQAALSKKELAYNKQPVSYRCTIL